MLRSAITTILRGGSRRRAGALAIPLLLLATACQPAPAGGGRTWATKRPPTTTTTVNPATTTTAPTTTTLAPTTTTTAAGPGTDLTLRDTGMTRVRVELSSQAAWVAVELVGTQIEASRVVASSGSLQITSLGGQQIAGHGQGTATVDLVLRVPPGASTALTMCKNYLGPASVNVRRLTDGDVVIASLHNTSTSWAVAPGSCEGAASATLARADLIGPVRWPARRDPRPLVLANYYPWYDAGNLGGPFLDAPTGPADTSNPEQVGEAVDLALASGIDGFIVEYEATAAHESKIDHVFDAADARPGFKTALMLDFAILQYRLGGLTDAVLNLALGELASHASRPSQLKVGGQPVVFIYSGGLVDGALWSAALSRLATLTGVQPFVVTDNPILPSPGRHDYGTHGQTTPAQLAEWAMDRLLTLQERPGLYGVAGPLWVAPVTPGYDDRALGRPQSLFVPRDGGLRYEQSWDAALASLPDWIIVTSWNEYHEQTHVMPGSTTGNQALAQTKARSATFHTTG